MLRPMGASITLHTKWMPRLVRKKHHLWANMGLGQGVLVTAVRVIRVIFAQRVHRNTISAQRAKPHEPGPVMGQGMWENKLTGLRDHVHALGSAQGPSGRTRVKRRSWLISHRGIVPTQAMRAGPEWAKGTKSVLCDLVGPSFSNNNPWATDLTH